MSDDRDANLYPFTPPPPSPGSGSGAKRPRRPRRSRLTKTAAGLAVILGTGTGAAAVALATSSGTVPASAAGAATTVAPSATTTPSANPNPPRAFRRIIGGGSGGPGGFAAFAGPGALGGGVIHASYTIDGPNGGYETIDTQYGTVEDVSSSSITVKSADGFIQTYDVTTSTLVEADYEGVLSVKVGDTVSIQAVTAGSTVTAQRIQDVTQVQAGRPDWAAGPSTGPAPADTTPSDTTPSTTTPSTTTTPPGAA
jgi:hypothetical protein